MNDKLPHISEQLEQHNQNALLARARKKIEAGKPVTRQEEKAVERATNEARRQVELPYMRRMPKGDYIREFGGTTKVYREWETKWGFPWNGGDDYVDALACQRWYREHAVECHRQTASASKVGDAADEQWKIARAEKAKLELAERRKQLVSIEAVERDLLEMFALIRDGLEICCDRDRELIVTRLREALEAWKDHDYVRANGRGADNGAH